MKKAWEKKLAQIEQQLNKLGVETFNVLFRQDGDFGPYAIFCRVPLELLEVDFYQRGIIPAQAKNIKSRFIEEACDPLKLSFRDDALIVLDGWQRTNLLLEMAWDFHYAIVHFGLTEEKEAALFFEANDTARKVSGWNKFTAALARGSEHHKQLLQIAAEHRLSTPYTQGVEKQKQADIPSPVYLNDPYKKGGYPLVHALCAILDQCWRGPDGNVLESAKETSIIRGLANFLKKDYLGPNGLPWLTLLRNMRQTTPDQLTEKARKSTTKRVDARQYTDALCAIFGRSPIAYKKAA